MVRLICLLIYGFSLLHLSAQSKDYLREEIARLKTDSIINADLISDHEVRIRILTEYADNIKKNNNKLKQDSISMIRIIDSFQTQLASSLMDRENLVMSNLVLSLERDSLNKIINELRKNNSSYSFRNSTNIENFLYYFFSSVFSNNNFDSLVYVHSPIILDIINQDLGFGRFWNMGVFCSLYTSDDYGYNFYEDFFGENQPDLYNLRLYKDQEPIGGRCDEATSPDGIYYHLINSLPEDWDVERGVSIPPPAKFRNLKKIVVQVQYDKWIRKTIYFAQSNNIWYMIYIQDCDCST